MIMIQGLLAAVSVIFRFAFLFGIYYLIKGILLLSGRRIPLRGKEGMENEEWKKWASGEGRVCLYWAGILIFASICFLVIKMISFLFVVLFCVLLVIGYVKRVKNNMNYRK